MLFIPYGSLHGTKVFLTLGLVLSEYVLYFIAVVLIVSLFILLYSNFYINSSSYFRFYRLLLVVFIIVITMLIIRVNRFWLLLVWWDLLGLVSFILVLFYIRNNRVTGALSTVLRGRLGDFLLLLVIGRQINSKARIFFCFILIRVVLISVSLTKRAQFPFIGWLVRAIAAPTPVRALVHRSTLVTAGVLLLLAHRWWILVRVCRGFLLFIRLISLLFSGFLAVFEIDIKKLVALRTLSQISLCIIGLSSHLFVQSYVYILVHALFKSLLFLQLGYVIYMAIGQQRMRSVKIVINSLTRSCLLVSLFSLSGLLYFSRITVKESLFLRILKWENFCFSNIIFLFGLSITFVYCLRLLFSLVITKRGVVYGFMKNSTIYTISCIIVVVVIFFNYFVTRLVFYFSINVCEEPLLVTLIAVVVFLSWSFISFNLKVISNIFIARYLLTYLSKKIIWVPFFEVFLTKILIDMFCAFRYVHIRVIGIRGSSIAILYISVIGVLIIF